jgi:hypothetical protein
MSESAVTLYVVPETKTALNSIAEYGSFVTPQRILYVGVGTPVIVFTLSDTGIVLDVTVPMVILGAALGSV